MDALWILAGFATITVCGVAFVAIYDAVVAFLARFRQET